MKNKIPKQCVVSLTIAKQFCPWSMPITNRLTRPKMNTKGFFHKLTQQIQ